MNGILVVNAYLRGEKFEVLYNHIKKAAQKAGVILEIRNNEEMQFFDGEADFVLFWDKDVNLAKRLENKGIPVFNSSQAIALCDDKAKTYLTLEGVVPQPLTYIAPLSYSETDYIGFVNAATEKLGFPVVFKECFGSFGEQVYLCNSASDVLSHVNEKPFLLQQYIEGGNEDVRLEIVGDKCVAAMTRKNKNDFRSNITNGATAEEYTPTQSEIELAVKACRALGLDFGGVDILNHSLICEVNSNAHIINLLNITGKDAAKDIFDYIIKKL